MEAKAKSDPSILIAIKRLESRIPDLAALLLDRQPYIAHGESGPVKGHIENGEFKVRAQKLDDGSLLQHTKLAKTSISKILKKSGYGEAPIGRALHAFDAVPDDKRVELVPGLKIVKWSIQRLELDLSRAELMDPLIPVKTAFEFLACHIGSAIYDASEPFAHIRESLQTGVLSPEFLAVERLTSNEYEPIHGIVFEGNNPHATVQIRLFGWLAFRVHFLRLSIAGPRFVYTHRLDTMEEDVQMIHEEAA